MARALTRIPTPETERGPAEIAGPMTGNQLERFARAEQATPDRARTFDDPGDCDRLTLLKARYEPADMFRASPIIPRASETRLKEPARAGCHLTARGSICKFNLTGEEND